MYVPVQFQMPCSVVTDEKLYKISADFMGNCFPPFNSFIVIIRHNSVVELVFHIVKLKRNSGAGPSVVDQLKCCLANPPERHIGINRIY